MTSPFKLNNASSRHLSPDKSVQAFITDIADNREAFELFKEQVQKKGYLGQIKPLIHTQQDYYQRYI
jgi:hypothetical protein